MISIYSTASFKVGIGGLVELDTQSHLFVCAEDYLPDCLPAFQHDCLPTFQHACPAYLHADLSVYNVPACLHDFLPSSLSDCLPVSVGLSVVTISLLEYGDSCVGSVLEVNKSKNVEPEIISM